MISFIRACSVISAPLVIFLCLSISRYFLLWWLLYPKKKEKCWQRKPVRILFGLSFLNNYFTGKKVGSFFHCFSNLCNYLMSRVTCNVKRYHYCKILESLRICRLKLTSFSFLKSGVHMQHLNLAKSWILWSRFICIF